MCPVPETACPLRSRPPVLFGLERFHAKVAIIFAASSMRTCCRFDCGLVLRVAAAAALWKIDRNSSLAMPFLAWALKDEYWGVAPRAVEILAEIGRTAVVPDLIRLADRRLAHGPFYFEEFSSAAGGADSSSLLAAVSDAIGHCARGKWEGPSYLSEARDILMKLAAFDDDLVRASASRAMAQLELIPELRKLRRH